MITLWLGTVVLLVIPISGASAASAAIAATLISIGLSFLSLTRLVAACAFLQKFISKGLTVILIGRALTSQELFIFLLKGAVRIRKPYEKGIGNFFVSKFSIIVY